jgi:hypothetical protein
MDELKAVNRLADAVLELKKAGYSIQTFEFEDRKEVDLNGKLSWRHLKIIAGRHTDFNEPALEVSGLCEKLSTGDSPLLHGSLPGTGQGSSSGQCQTGGEGR